jgi:thiol-disulfide isomerase/thioredoxin
MFFNSPYVKQANPADYSYKSKSVSNKNVKSGFLFIGVDWCGYCRMVKPEVDMLAQLVGAKIPVIFADADDKKYQKLLKDLEVKSFPSLYIIKNNKLVKYEGERTYRAFMEKIN